MVGNFLEFKNKTQKGLRVMDVIITLISFAWTGYLYVEKGFYFWFWFWLLFSIISLILVINNPVEKIEKKLIGSIIKGRK